MARAKDTLRRSMRRVRRSISDDQREASARAAAHNLLRSPECIAALSAARIVAVYAAVRNELDPAPLVAELRDRGITLAYPRVIPNQRRLVFHRVDDPSQLAPGVLGIPEPDASAPVVPTGRIDVFIVPGLAFDGTGTRLGWGKGHYDQTLTDNRAALRVGYAYDAQVIDTVPRGAHDLPMHFLVTESGARRCSG